MFTDLDSSGNEVCITYIKNGGSKKQYRQFTIYHPDGMQIESVEEYLKKIIPGLDFRWEMFSITPHNKVVFNLGDEFVEYLQDSVVVEEEPWEEARYKLVFSVPKMSNNVEQVFSGTMDDALEYAKYTCERRYFDFKDIFIETTDSGQEKEWKKINLPE